MRSFRSWIVLSLLLNTGCIVGTPDYTGKPCLEASDCPGGYACAALGPGEDPACVPSSLSETADGGSQQPGEVPADASGGPYYCDAVKAILDAYCVSCHRSPPSNGAPSYMRLDVYGLSGTIQGAGEQASRIVSRAVTARTMPPSFSPQPTDGDRAVLSAWAAAGAPECADAPPPPPPPDAGTADAGGIGQVPQTVSFSQHVQPIFDAYCVSCHSDNVESGHLKLERGDSYDELLDDARCDSNLWIVEPWDPQNSVLWRALSAHSSSCAPAMPYNSPGLKAIAPTEFAIIEKWISQGAANN